MAEKNSKTIKHWIESAEYDLESARVMLKGGRFLYVGFMCHITLEKMFKAYFVKAKGTTPPYIHSLDTLARESGIYDELSREQIALIVELDPMNIKARYPGEKNDIAKLLTPKRCPHLISKTKELFEWLMKKLKER